MHFRVVILLLLGVALCSLAARVENYSDGTVVRHPVPILRGTLENRGATTVTVTRRSAGGAPLAMTGQAHEGRFLALTKLVPGRNTVEIQAGGERVALNLIYRPQSNPWLVRVFYLVDSAGGTDYETPLGDDPQNWRQKLGTAALLMQSFTAERLHDLGYDRRTFNLETDEAGDVVVHLLRGDRPAREYYALDGLAMWRHSGELLRAQYPRARSKDLVVCAFTHFDRETKKVYCHSALGGGDLAYFGGANVFAWPDSPADAQAAFSDATRVDPAKTFSDSVGRHAYWAIASTTIGACLHELGHTFGLPHTTYPHDIMTRGIDRFNRAFTLVEPPHARRETPLVFGEDVIGRWDPPSASALVSTVPFALDDPSDRPGPRTTIRVDLKHEQLVLASPHGIRFAGFHAKGDCVYHLDLPRAGTVPTRCVVPIADLAAEVNTDQVRIRVVDDAGHTARAGMDDLLRGPFVQAWHVAPKQAEWTDTGQFPTPPPGYPQHVAAVPAPLVDAGRPFVNLLELLPDGPRVEQAAYLYRTIVCPSPRRIRLVTGSDDALRVWLNGTAVQKALALRGASPDAESVVCELREGENLLVAEVSQASGGWGLYLRIEDDAGEALELTDAGSLVTVGDAARRLRAILRGPFVRRWHLATETVPWTDHGAFLSLSPERRAELERNAAATPTIASDDAFVDLIAHVKGTRKENCTAYAYRTVRSPVARTVRLLTGSDDALRVWLNGVPVQQVLALRGAVSDADRAEVQLQPGENRLLVEVSQGGGGWGLILRFQDQDGADLILSDDGQLVRMGDAAP